MAATLLFLLILIVSLAALGRGAIPRAERRPLRTWQRPDLAATIARDGQVIWARNEGQRRLAGPDHTSSVRRGDVDELVAAVGRPLG